MPKKGNENYNTEDNKTDYSAASPSEMSICSVSLCLSLSRLSLVVSDRPKIIMFIT